MLALIAALGFASIFEDADTCFERGGKRVMVRDENGVAEVVCLLPGGEKPDFLFAHDFE